MDEARDKEGRRAKTLLIAGWSTFGTSYTAAILTGVLYNDITGVHNNYGYWLLAPLVGPIGAAFESESSFGVMFGAGMAIAQIGGLAVGILGTVRYRQWKHGVSLSALPMRGGGQLGVRMRF